MNARLLVLAIRVKAFQWALLFFAILISGLSLIFFPSLSRLSLFRSETQKTEAQILKIKEISAQNKDLKTVVKELNEELLDLNRRLILPGEHARVISAVAEAAQSNGITITSIKPLSAQRPGTPPDGKKITPVLFELKLKATYQTFGEFLEALKAFPVALTVESFDMALQEKNPGLLKIEMIIAAFEERD
jgi:Tfp pilus assembly protein PilO